MDKIKEGTRIKFRNEKGTYIVWACNDRYYICTKPYNFKRTRFYTIVDTVEEIRGTENLVLSLGCEDKESAKEMLNRISTGETKISHRNRVRLEIREISGPNEIREILGVKL